MSVEEKLRSKLLYKIELMALKTIPIIMVLCSMCNSILSYFNIDVTILNYIGGVSILPLLFFYLSSYTFKFCSYHRMFLHYLLIADGINIYDYHIGFSLEDLEYLCLHMIIIAIWLFIITYLYIHKK